MQQLGAMSDTDRSYETMRSDFGLNTPPSPARGEFRKKAGLSAGALLLTGSLIGWSASAIGPSGNVRASGPAATPIAASAATRTIGSSADSYAPLVEQVSPAVVTVMSERRIRNT